MLPPCSRSKTCSPGSSCNSLVWTRISDSGHLLDKKTSPCGPEDFTLRNRRYTLWTRQYHLMDQKTSHFGPKNITLRTRRHHLVDQKTSPAGPEDVLERGEAECLGQKARHPDPPVVLPQDTRHPLPVSSRTSSRRQSGAVLDYPSVFPPNCHTAIPAPAHLGEYIVPAGPHPPGGRHRGALQHLPGQFWYMQY